MSSAWHPGRIALVALSLGGVTLLPSVSWADNPIVQTNYTADPAPVVYDDRLYLYTSHDEDVSVDNFYTMNDWRLYSTVDMVNWTDHGSPAGYKNFSWGTGDAWAPQGISRNGKYYLYVPLNNATGSKVGVGVATSPGGPFMDPLGKALAASGSGNIDPTVFIDDDDQAYMYWGNGSLRYVKLNTDMTSYSGSPTTVAMSGFTEGPWFYKRESLYYLVYASTAGTEKISYATSDSPTGPWTMRGDIMGSGTTFTNHPGVIDYKGHSYFFYHNSSLPGGGDYKRSVCVEEFTYAADGKIPSIKGTTNGPAPIAALDPFSQVEAETIAFSSGLKTETCTDTGGGLNVKSISNGDYIKVKNVDFLAGVTSFDARVSGAAGDAKVELHLDSQTGTLLGTCDVSGASSWTTKTCAVSGGSGKHDLFLKFTGGSGDLFKFNWWKFTAVSDPTGGTGGAAGSGGSSGASGLGGSSGASGLGGAGGRAAGSAGMTGGSAGMTGGSAGMTVGSAGRPGASGGGAGTNTSGAGAAGDLRGGTGGTAAGQGGALAAGAGPAHGGGGAANAGRGGSPAGNGAAGLGPSEGPGGTDSPTGCGCRASSGASPGAPMSLMLLLGLRLRRRSARALTRGGVTK